MVDLNCISIKLLYKKNVWPWITGAVTPDTRFETVSYSDLIQVRLVSAILWRIKRWIKKKLKAWTHAWDTEKGSLYTTCSLKRWRWSLLRECGSSDVEVSAQKCRNFPGGLWDDGEGVCLLPPFTSHGRLEWISFGLGQRMSPHVHTHMHAHTSTHTCAHTELENLGTRGLHQLAICMLGFNWHPENGENRKHSGKKKRTW